MNDAPLANPRCASSDAARICFCDLRKSDKFPYLQTRNPPLKPPLTQVTPEVQLLEFGLVLRVFSLLS